MSAGARVAAFVSLLVVVFAAAALAGQAIDPKTGPSTVRQGAHAAGAHGDGAPARAAHGAAGYRLVVTNTRFAAGRSAPLRFRVVDAAGDTVRAFETEQARRMHVIVVRRDLRRYQHLHPEQGSDGAWTVALELPEAGVYQAFADFAIAGRQHVLGVDLFVPGIFTPVELPPRSDSASVDGYEVRLHAHDADRLTFAVTRGGRPVADLQLYLGARGHLVALRDGDLHYRHVHPVDASRNEIAFATGGAEPGTYRLFMQFRHGGRVHTATFTR